MAGRHFSIREKRIFILCMLVIFVYAGFNFVFKPMKEKTFLQDGRIKKKEEELKKNLRIINKTKSVNEEYGRYEEFLKQKTSDQQEMATILSEIESVANQISMRIADMKPQKVRKIDFYNNFSVSLSIEGELGNIVQFLYILQNAPHRFKADEIRFEKKSIRTTQMVCRLVLSRDLIPE